MFSRFLDRQRIKRRIRQLRAEIYEGSQPPSLEDIRRIPIELQPLEDRFDLLETGRLERKAGPLCIDIYDVQESWLREVKINVVVADQALETNANVLTEKGQVGIKKLIREERYKTVKRWVELLIPILSLIIAILALTRK
jgi:hypothetical protein